MSRVRLARRKSIATPEAHDSEASATPTTKQDSDRARRGWKRSAVPPPLMLFHPFTPVSSFSEKTAPDLLLDRGKMLSTESLLTERFRTKDGSALSTEGSDSPGKTRLGCQHGFERSGTVLTAGARRSFS